MSAAVGGGLEIRTLATTIADGAGIIRGKFPDKRSEAHRYRSGN